MPNARHIIKIVSKLISFNNNNINNNIIIPKGLFSLLDCEIKYPTAQDIDQIKEK